MDHQLYRSQSPEQPVPRDRAVTIFFAIMAFFVLAGSAVIVFAVVRSNAIYAEFMDGCEHDHKHYECMLLWRASKSDDPTLVPIPIPIPIPR